MKTGVRVPVVSLALTAGFVYATVRLATRHESGAWASREQQQRPADEDGRPSALESGKRVFEQSCQICHSSEMVEHQRLTKQQWEAEVEKMIGWGAPVTQEERPALLAFLNGRLGDSVAPLLPLRWGAVQLRELMVRPPLEPLAPDASRSRGHSLYAEHCAACHGADANGGDAGGILWDRPSLASRAEFGMLLEEGRGKMPGFKSVLVNRNDLDDLLAFLREKP